MTQANDIDQINPDDVDLHEAPLGYAIQVLGEHAGSIEGFPGQLDHIEVDPHWEEKGVARAALEEFIKLSQRRGETTVETNNAVHPAMEHILKTEGFEPREDEIGWQKEVK